MQSQSQSQPPLQLQPQSQPQPQPRSSSGLVSPLQNLSLSDEVKDEVNKASEANSDYELAPPPPRRVTPKPEEPKTEPPAPNKSMRTSDEAINQPRPVTPKPEEAKTEPPAPNESMRTLDGEINQLDEGSPLGIPIKLGLYQIALVMPGLHMSSRPAINAELAKIYSLFAIPQFRGDLASAQQEVLRKLESMRIASPENWMPLSEERRRIESDQYNPAAERIFYREKAVQLMTERYEILKQRGDGEVFAINALYDLITYYNNLADSYEMCLDFDNAIKTFRKAGELLASVDCQHHLYNPVLTVNELISQARALMGKYGFTPEVEDLMRQSLVHAMKLADLGAIPLKLQDLLLHYFAQLEGKNPPSDFCKTILELFEKNYSSENYHQYSSEYYFKSYYKGILLAVPYFFLGQELEAKEEYSQAILYFKKADAYYNDSIINKPKKWQEARLCNKRALIKALISYANAIERNKKSNEVYLLLFEAYQQLLLIDREQPLTQAEKDEINRLSAHLVRLEAEFAAQPPVAPSSHALWSLLQEEYFRPVTFESCQSNLSSILEDPNSNEQLCELLKRRFYPELYPINAPKNSLRYDLHEGSLVIYYYFNNELVSKTIPREHASEFYLHDLEKSAEKLYKAAGILNEDINAKLRKNFNVRTVYIDPQHTPIRFFVTFNSASQQEKKAGVFATVEPVATLNLTATGLELNETVSRVVKPIPYWTQAKPTEALMVSEEEAKNEVEATQRWQPRIKILPTRYVLQSKRALSEYSLPIIMPRYKGLTLRQMLADPNFCTSLDGVCDFMTGLLQQVGKLHSLYLVHRDLHFHNIMVEKEINILDFGLSQCYNRYNAEALVSAPPLFNQMIHSSEDPPFKIKKGKTSFEDQKLLEVAKLGRLLILVLLISPYIDIELQLSEIRDTKNDNHIDFQRLCFSGDFGRRIMPRNRGHGLENLRLLSCNMMNKKTSAKGVLEQVTRLKYEPAQPTAEYQAALTEAFAKADGIELEASSQPPVDNSRIEEKESVTQRARLKMRGSIAAIRAHLSQFGPAYLINSNSTILHQFVNCLGCKAIIRDLNLDQASSSPLTELVLKKLEAIDGELEVQLREVEKLPPDSAKAKSLLKKVEKYCKQRDDLSASNAIDGAAELTTKLFKKLTQANTVPKLPPTFFNRQRALLSDLRQQPAVVESSPNADYKPGKK